MRKFQTRDNFQHTFIYSIFVTIQLWISGQCCVFCRKDFVGVFMSPFETTEDTLNSYYFSNLFEPIAKVSTEFKTIVIPVEYSQQSAQSIYKTSITVATWNTNNTTALTTRSLNIILYQDMELLENIELIHRITTQANQISQNTIKELIIHNFLGDSNDFKQKLALYGNLAKSHGMKLGLLLSMEKLLDDSPLTKLSNYIRDSIVFIDSIYIEISRSPAALTHSVDIFVKKKLRVASFILNFISKAVNKNFSLGIVGSWPDTTEDGEIDYMKQVYFWRNLTEIGHSKNLAVLLREAFDNFYTEPHNLCGMGWWTMQNDLLSKQKSKFLFEDKMLLAEREMLKSSQWFVSQMVRDIEFDKENILALYNLDETLFYLKFLNMSIHQILTIFVEKLASKFSRILVLSQLVLPTTKTNVENLLEVVAQHNLQFPMSFLKISVSVDIKYKEEIEILIGNMARANKFGSVDQILLFAENLDEFYLSGNWIQEHIKENTYLANVEICLHVNIDICSNLSHYLEATNSKSFKEAFNCIFFRYFPGERKMGHRYGLDRVTLQVLGTFERCKRQLNRVTTGFKVGFETAYYSPPNTANEDFPSAFLFWNRINEWAANSKTQVIVHNAFDPINGTSSKESSNSALWRLLPFSNATTDIQFEDKRITTLKKLQTLISKSESKSDAFMPMGFVLIATFLAMIALLVIWLINRRLKRNKEKHNFLEAHDLKTLSERTKLLPATSFSPDFSEEVGKGNFGIVYKCFMPEFESIVAVKTATSGINDFDQYSIRCIIAEMKAMSQLGQHQNILRMMGASVEGRVFMVTEFCENGSLLGYLQVSSLKMCKLSNYELLQFCTEITNGMCYLEENKVIHGDLAARNVLLSGNKVCKISDFGLSRILDLHDIYVKKGDEPLPWRWMAPESLIRREFSFKSDIWSMGVTFWEVYTLGKVPYAEIEWDGTFCDKLVDGQRLPKPKLSDEILYRILWSCWELNAARRPQAYEILNDLTKLKCSEYVVI